MLSGGVGLLFYILPGALGLRAVGPNIVGLIVLPFPIAIAIAIANSLNNQEIARRFSIHEKTVRNHVSNIFNKLQVADRAQAIIRAQEAGIGNEARKNY